MGLRILAKFNDDLRNSPTFHENERIPITINFYYYKIILEIYLDTSGEVLLIRINRFITILLPYKVYILFFSNFKVINKTIL